MALSRPTHRIVAKDRREERGNDEEDNLRMRGTDSSACQGAPPDLVCVMRSGQVRHGASLEGIPSASRRGLQRIASQARWLRSPLGPSGIDKQEGDAEIESIVNATDQCPRLLTYNFRVNPRLETFHGVAVTQVVEPLLEAHCPFA
jgi:hypothetical protein